MLHDIASAFRSMLRHPGFTAGVILTMALGVGTTISVYSVAYAVLMDPLPVGDPDRLVTIWVGTTSAGRRLLTGRLDLPCDPRPKSHGGRQKNYTPVSSERA